LGDPRLYWLSAGRPPAVPKVKPGVGFGRPLALLVVSWATPGCTESKAGGRLWATPGFTGCQLGDPRLYRK
jgi:hypothetical protein